MGQSDIQQLYNKLGDLHQDVIEFKVSNARLEEKLFSTNKTVANLQEEVNKLKEDTWDKQKFYVGLGVVGLLQVIGFFV